MRQKESEYSALEDVAEDLKKEIIRANVDPKHPCHYMCFCTVMDNKSPTSRYVILRKFLSDQMKMIFFTDFRSSKVKEILENNQTMVLAYHPKKKYQLRIEGYAEVDNNNSTAKKYFDEQVKNAKDYNSLVAPGTKLEKAEEAGLLRNSQDDKFFTVISHTVTAIDWLKLNRESSHLRAQFLYSKGQMAEASWLAP